jgi:hypothetical protein
MLPLLDLVVAGPRALERVRPDHDLAAPRDDRQQHLEELLTVVAVERDRRVVVPLAVSARGGGLETADRTAEPRELAH